MLLSGRLLTKKKQVPKWVFYSGFRSECVLRVSPFKRILDDGSVSKSLAGQ
jgi:hypothetical protein